MQLYIKHWHKTNYNQGSLATGKTPRCLTFYVSCCTDEKLKCMTFLLEKVYTRAIQKVTVNCSLWEAGWGWGHRSSVEGQSVVVEP